MDDYNDIINKSRPSHINDAFSVKHPKMSTADRAKIFSPFAALRGHSDYVKKRERITVKKIELSADDAYIISETLAFISEQLRLGETPTAEITYFIRDKERKNEGKYVTLRGRISKFNTDMGFIKISDQNIFIEDIYSIIIADDINIPISPK